MGSMELLKGLYGFGFFGLSTWNLRFRVYGVCIVIDGDSIRFRSLSLSAEK